MSTPDTAILENVAITDKSLGFFNEIFGTGWQNIINGTSSTGGAGETLFTCFQGMNAVILAAVTVLMFWVTSSGIIGTAHEGESLGKRYSTLWTPIRSAFSISLLMPYPGGGGLSLMQAVVLKFLYLSIGGANYLATIVIAFMVSQGGALSIPTAPVPLANGLASEMLKNLVFQEHYSARENESYGTGVDDASSKVTEDGEEYVVKSFVFTPPGQSLIYYPFMGRVKTSCQSKDSSICEQEHQLGIKLSEDLRPIAKAITSQWVNGANTPMDDTQVNAYNNAINNYVTQSQSITTSAMNGIVSNEKVKELLNDVKTNGWAWLGVYYWKVAQINEEAQKKIQTKVSISSAVNETALSLSAGREIDSSLQRYRDFIKRVNVGRLQQIKMAAASDDSSGGWVLLNSFLSDAIGSSISPFGDNTAMTGAASVMARTISKGDPIANLQSLGHQLINTASTLITISAGASVAGWLSDPSSSESSEKSGALSSGGASAITGISGKLISAIQAFLMPIALAFLTGGVVLAYYLPSLPFVLWSSAVVGWIILTMELMVAAPVWAAMHAIPEGEGLAGQHGRQGYMLFFGILVRPALHVVGFFMSMVVVVVIGHFIGEAYLDFTTANGKDNAPWGPVSQVVAWIATILIGTSTCIIATHKTFSLITFLPDNILRWAGGNQPSLGEHGDESRTSSTFNTAIAATRGAATGGAAQAAAKVAQIDANNAAIMKQQANHLSQGTK